MNWYTKNNNSSPITVKRFAVQGWIDDFESNPSEWRAQRTKRTAAAHQHTNNGNCGNVKNRNRSQNHYDEDEKKRPAHKYRRLYGVVNGERLFWYFISRQFRTCQKPNFLLNLARLLCYEFQSRQLCATEYVQSTHNSQSIRKLRLNWTAKEKKCWKTRQNLPWNSLIM